MLQSLNVSYNTVVDRIEYGASGVAVHATNGSTFKADAAVVTLPLGVLKKGTVAFEPPLPARKTEAIERLGYGVLNKVRHCSTQLYRGLRRQLYKQPHKNMHSLHEQNV